MAPNRIGVMTCALNEAVTIPFVLEPWLGKADLVVYVDTGSIDGTWELVHTLFPQHIASGALLPLRIACPNYDIWRARQAAIDAMTGAQIHFALKIDADDVFYDDGVDNLLQATRLATADVTHVSCQNFELYQWEARDDLAWLAALGEGKDIFWEMAFVPRHNRAYRIDRGAYASGSWVDEAQTGKPEGIIVPETMREHNTTGLFGAHYGWARPVERKERKIEIWYGNPEADPRVSTLHLGTDWRKPDRKFRAHPQSVHRLVAPVHAWFVDRCR